MCSVWEEGKGMEARVVLIPGIGCLFTGKHEVIEWFVHDG